LAPFTWQMTTQSPYPSLNSMCVSSGGSNKVITGTSRDDALLEASYSDIIKGRGGNDRIMDATDTIM
jgi:hypothetical protein